MTTHAGAHERNWVRVTSDAQWQPRDSHGMLVYNDHMWILGGWFSPRLPNPRDVWKSPDGKQWTRAVEAAPWVHSDLSAAMVFNDKMWVMGGRKLPGAENSNKVWSSTDGTHWTLETENAGWCPRVSAMYVVFKDKMWVMGGTENFYDHREAMVKNDVWSSADGKHWERITAHAGWSRRAHGQALVFDGKIWVLGGGLWHPQHVARNDVWCSEDGVRWTQVANTAPWAPRIWFASVVYRARMWVLGGWSKEHDNFGDIWYSTDGKNWSEVTSDVIWKHRHAHSVCVFQDKLWVAGGHARPLSNEVWCLQIPETWFDGRWR